jgi:glycosyltransferase involved in cell wall biosynthesis
MPATIALAMIVKDEAPIIERCLASAVGVIDRWLIIDTGSSDDTPQLIASRLAGIPGTLFHRPWVDFGHNRSELVALAREAADYLLLLDADMELLVDPAFDKRLDADAYYLHYTGGLDYAQKLLVRAELDWRYVGATHEYIHSDRCRRVETLRSLRVRHRADGSSRAVKGERDAALLERQLQQDPGDARAAFYLARTYCDQGRLEEAIEQFAKRVALGGWLEEQWQAAYEAGRLSLELRREDQGVGWLLRAYQMHPARAEPLYALAHWYRRSERFHLAYVFAKAASRIAYPEDKLFVEREVYDHRLLDELSLAAYYVGQFGESADLCRRLLAEARFPATERQRIQANLSFAAAAVKPMVFGLGTGRCGTRSLARLLALQEGVAVAHETCLLPWVFDEPKLLEHLGRIQRYGGRLVGDVAFYYLNYVDQILKRYPDSTFICLKRDKAATVASYLAWTGNKNHWTRRDSRHWTDQWCPDRYDDCYPKFDAGKELALGLYWDHYYSHAEYLQQQYPQRFRVFPLTSLADERGQTEILEFAGISREAARTDLDIASRP